MGHFKCKCGTILPLKTGVEDHERYLTKKIVISDRFHDFMKNLDKVESQPFISKLGAQIEHFWDIFDTYSISALVCPECDRIWLQEKKGDPSMNSYVREDDLSSE